MTRYLASILLLIASPSWSAGDVTEARCDELGSVCICNETLTANEGTHTVAFDPSGSEGGSEKECAVVNAGKAVQGLTGQSNTSVLWNDSGISNPIETGGSGYVMNFESGVNRLNDQTRTFTNGTYCQRHYVNYHPDQDCTANADCIGAGNPVSCCSNPGTGSCDCNIKGPRNDGAGSAGDHPGFQVATDDPASRWNHDAATFSSSAFSAASPNQGCRPHGSNTGCRSVSAMQESYSAGSLTLEDIDGGWLRWEICFDHDLTEAQVTGAGGLNDLYGGSLTYPGADHLFFRGRIDIITGTHAGEQIMYGPSYPGGTSATADSGLRVWIATSAKGSPNSMITGDVFTVYNMVAIQTTADPSFWIGAASEMEGTVAPTGVLAWQPSTNPILLTTEDGPLGGK